LLLTILVCSVSTAAQEPEPEVTRQRFATPSEAVTGIYAAVSAEAGENPDWELVRAHFDPAAVIVLRASRDETRLFDVDGFIADFEAFYERLGAERGFRERVLSSRVLEYGNIAQVTVVYEASVDGSERPPQRGLDLWHLMLRDGRWWAVSVVNDAEAAAGPIPSEAFEP
jgi:hypothetical protein